MKTKSSKSSKTRKKPAVRKQTGKVHLSPTASGLTSQAGLIPVVKYLQRIGFEKIINQDIPHKRGDNADYQLTDMVMFTLVGIIGGATSMAKVCGVWSDSVLGVRQRFLHFRAIRFTDLAIRSVKGVK